LYATDLSPNSVYVLQYVINSAQKHDAKLVALHVMENLPPMTASLIELYLNEDRIDKISKERIAHTKKRIFNRIELLFAKEMQRFPGSREIIDTIEVAVGYPADEILKKADALGCDVIAMGTHSKGFLKHAYFGSTAKKVLRRTKMPIMIVPMPEENGDLTIKDS
jgi:nucleotide-binding universal stress UspA family protein